MDPATIAAIIGSVTAATLTATQAAINTASVPEGNRVGIITNETPFTLVQSSAANRYGYWTDAPPHDVSGRPHIQDLFGAWKKKLSHEISEEDRKIIREKTLYTELTNAEAILFAEWIPEATKSYNNRPGSFHMKGANYGVEGVAVYEMEDRTPSPIFCFYISGGGSWHDATYAGCEILSETEWGKYKDAATGEYDLYKLMDRFDATGDGTIKMSDNPTIAVSTTGDARTATNNKWYCDVTCGLTSSFIVRTGYWE